MNCAARDWRSRWRPGIVLTGGSAKMEGAIELAEEVFHMPVRLGVPQYVTGLSEVVSNPIHATGVGLLLYAKSNMEIATHGSAAARGRHEEFAGANEGLVSGQFLIELMITNVGELECSN